MDRVVVQGLGVVGSAMAVALADVLGPDSSRRFDVTGLDLPTALGRARIAAINEGRLPFETSDPALRQAAASARDAGCLQATDDAAVIAQADVVVVDVNLDVEDQADELPRIDFSAFEAAIDTIGRHIRPGALVLIETTVPPGTCDRVVAPALDRALLERGLPAGSALLAHSYERVMPGDRFLESITQIWRVYAGRTESAADACQRFLEAFIDLDRFPATRLATTTASEMAKVLENAYRATNIAFVEEWGRLAEAAGVDLFEVVDAIRVRPTHSNLRQPGLGAGGYCLPKDPLMGGIAARQLFDRPELEFPFSERAVRTNAASPTAAAGRLGTLLGGLVARHVLILGVAYRPEVADTRRSPSETLTVELRNRGAVVTWHDPWVAYWEELDEARETETLPTPDRADAVVFAVGHGEFRHLDVLDWLAGARPLIFDANRVLADDRRAALIDAGVVVASIGRA